MLEFLKKNGYSILKLFLIQIGMTVFGLMLTMATAANRTVMIVSCAASVILYLYLLYAQIWEVGAKDQILMLHQGQKPSPAKGFLISLCANALNILLAALIVLAFYNIPRLASGELTPTQLSSGNLTGAALADQSDSEAAKEWTETNVREYEKFLAETPAWAMNTYQVASSVFGFLNGMYVGLITAFAADIPWVKLLVSLPAILVCGVGYIVGTTGFRLFPGKKEGKKAAEPAQWGNNLHKD